MSVRHWSLFIVFLIYGSKITAASRGFPATARLSCFILHHKNLDRLGSRIIRNRE